jgi:hypothetical protein
MALRVEQRLSSSDAWEQAFKHSVTAPASEQVGYLLDHIGPRFTAASLGISDARTLRRWRDEQAEPRDHVEALRLQLLFRMVYAIVSVYGKGTIAAGFLRSANPQLDDEAPLIILADGGPETQKPLLAALRAFLEG